MVLRTFNFWRFVGQYWKTPDFNDMFSKKSLKSMVLRTFNFWGFCGQYRDFHYYLPYFMSLRLIREPKKRNVQKFSISQSFKYLTTNVSQHLLTLLSIVHVGNFSSKRKNFHTLKVRMK